MVASLEKVVPTMEDAFTLLRLLARSATGQEFSTYTTVMTGPKRPDDLDGPEQLHVVLLDNGRSQMLGNELREMLRCIRCGACMNHCPVYLATGGHAYGWVYPGPMGAVLTPQLIGIEQAWPLPNASTFCGRCEEVCPVRIPLPKLMRYWREEQFRRQLTPAAARYGLGVWAFLAKRPALYRFAASVATRGLRLLSRAGRLRWAPLAGGWTGTPRSAGAAGPHLHEPVARGRAGPPVSARDAVLARVRHALATYRGGAGGCGGDGGGAARYPRPQPDPCPRRSSMQAGARAAVRRAGVGGHGRRALLDSLADVPAAVGSYLRQHNLPQKIVVAPEPLLDHASWDSQPLLRMRRGDAVDSDAIGVTLAIAGVAETGTLVLASSPERPTLLAYLPETSIVVVAADWIEGSYEEAWELVRAMPGGVPRSVNFVTGPSRTADIAQKLELGAHGPRRLLILIVARLPD